MLSLLSLLVVHSPPRSSCFLTRLSFVVPVLVLPVVQLYLWMASLSVGATRASETRTEGAALSAVWCEPARPGEEHRRDLTGGPESGASTLAAVGTGRHDSLTTEGGKVTCTVSWAYSVSQGPQTKRSTDPVYLLLYGEVFPFVFECMLWRRVC